MRDPKISEFVAATTDAKAKALLSPYSSYRMGFAWSVLPVMSRLQLLSAACPSVISEIERVRGRNIVARAERSVRVRDSLDTTLATLASWSHVASDILSLLDAPAGVRDCDPGIADTITQTPGGFEAAWPVLSDSDALTLMGHEAIVRKGGDRLRQALIAAILEALEFYPPYVQWLDPVFSTSSQTFLTHLPTVTIPEIHESAESADAGMWIRNLAIVVAGGVPVTEIITDLSAATSPLTDTAARKFFARMRSEFTAEEMRSFLSPEKALEAPGTSEVIASLTSEGLAQLASLMTECENFDEAWEAMTVLGYLEVAMWPEAVAKFPRECDTIRRVIVKVLTKSHERILANTVFAGSVIITSILEALVSPIDITGPIRNPNAEERAFAEALLKLADRTRNEITVTRDFCIDLKALLASSLVSDTNKDQLHRVGSYLFDDTVKELIRSRVEAPR